MSAYTDDVNEFVQLYQDSIAAAWNTLSLESTPDAEEHVKELHPGTVFCVAVAVFLSPNGEIKVSKLDQTTATNNWINANPKPDYILFKEANGSCALIRTKNPLGKGGAASVYPAAKFSINDGGSLSLDTSQPVVVKAAAIGQEATLAHEVQFKIGKVVPHGAEGKRVFGVGNISVAIFDHIPGQKLVEEIQFEGIQVTDALLNLSFDDRCQLVIDLSSQIANVHKVRVSHNDVNLDNVLVKIENGQYEAQSCQVIDFGQAQNFGTDIKPVSVGKFLWNGNELGQVSSPIVANPKIDIVPLGVMGYIIFTAKEGSPEQDYNLVIEKQIALKAAGDFNIKRAKAVAHTPFVMGKNFLDQAHWKLQYATADKLNELIHVFFERMVSDIPDERPTAEEVGRFFAEIKELANTQKIIQQEKILQRCDEVVYIGTKSKEQIINNSAMIRRLQRMLSSEHYLRRQRHPNRFLLQKVDQLISLEKRENPANEYALSMLQELLVFIKPLKPGDSSGIELTVSAMRMILFVKGKEQFLREIAVKFNHQKYTSLKESIDDLTADEQQELSELDPDMLKQLNEVTEAGWNAILEEEEPNQAQKERALWALRILELRKKQDEIEGKRLCLKRYEALASKYREEQSKINRGMSTPSEMVNPFASFLTGVSTYPAQLESRPAENQSEDLMNSYSSLVSSSEGIETACFEPNDSVPEVDNRPETTLVSVDKEDGNALRSVSERVEEQSDNAKYESALAQYKQALGNYEKVWSSLKKSEEKQSASQGNNDTKDAVVPTGRAFLHEASLAEKNGANYAELTTLLNYNCQLLMGCTEIINTTLDKPLDFSVQESISRPTDEEYDNALQQLKTNDKKETATKALKALGIVCAVVAVVTISVVLVGVVCMAWPPMVVTLPFLKPVVAFVAAAPIADVVAPAIAALGAALFFGRRALTNRDGKDLVKAAKSAQGAVKSRYRLFSTLAKDSPGKLDASAGASVTPPLEPPPAGLRMRSMGRKNGLGGLSL